MCFSTMPSLMPSNKQADMWSESADFNLLFPSARAEIKFIYTQDVFTDPDSARSECKQRAGVSGSNLSGRPGGSVGWGVGGGHSCLRDDIFAARRRGKVYQS